MQRMRMEVAAFISTVMAERSNRASNERGSANVMRSWQQRGRILGLLHEREALKSIGSARRGMHPAAAALLATELVPDLTDKTMRAWPAGN